VGQKTLDVIDSEGVKGILESHYSMTAWLLAPTTPTITGRWGPFRAAQCSSELFRTVQYCVGLWSELL
jgi:hypothetical protein